MISLIYKYRRMEYSSLVGNKDPTEQRKERKKLWESTSFLWWRSSACSEGASSKPIVPKAIAAMLAASKDKAIASPNLSECIARELSLVLGVNGTALMLVVQKEGAAVELS